MEHDTTREAEVSDAEFIELLRAEREIARVIMRYARASDRKDLGAMRSAYHPDAKDHHGVFDGTVDEYIEWSRQHHEQYDMFMHLMGYPHIEVRGSAACAETYCMLIQRMKPQQTYNAAVALHVWVACRYVDRFEKRDGSWKIVERNVVFEWFRNEWSSDLAAPALPSHGHLPFGRRSHEDLLYKVRESVLGEGA